MAAGRLLVVEVPGGSHGFRRGGGGGAWEILQPGWRMRFPVLHEFEIHEDEISLAESLTLASKEGTPVQVTYGVTGLASDAALGQGAEQALTPDVYAHDWATRLLREAVGGLSEERILDGAAGGQLEAVLREGLERIGIESLAVTASISGRAPGPPAAAEAAAPARRNLEHPIVLIGLDGADWQVMEPLMAAGRLPNLSRLRGKASWGHLRSGAVMLSPLLWTTAVTGKDPEDHGIIDFLVSDPATGEKVPITSAFRRVEALWNIFGGQGLFSSFVAWWATYPAETISGEIISDRVAYSLFDVGGSGGSAGGLVYPPGLWQEIQPLLVDPGDVGREEIQRLAKVDGEEIARAKSVLRQEGKDASRDRLVHLLKILASTRTYHAIGLEILGKGQPDLLGLYYQGIDEVSHRFAHCVSPPLPLCPPQEAERFGGTVAAFYEYQDALVGEIMDAIDPGSYVIVLSDHGFKNGGSRPRDVPPDIEGKPGKWHRRYGIFMAAGPGVPPAQIDNVTLHDVAPTVLRLAGLPEARDMSGRALVAPAQAPKVPEKIATYEGLSPELPAASRASVATAGAGAEEMLENLRSLGYIGGGGSAPAALPEAPEPVEAAGSEEVYESSSSVTSHGNLGALYLQKGDLGRAEKEFQAALEITPVFYPALMGLAEIRARQERFDEALALTRMAMEKSRAPEPGVYIRYVGFANKLGASDEAAAMLGRLRQERPGVAEIVVALALIQHHKGRLGPAERLLLEALEIDPGNPDAIARLVWLRKHSGREASVEPYLRRALEINPDNVLHRNLLGSLLERKGDLKGAEREFKAALEVAPDFGGTMANLGALYGRTGRLEESVEILTRALKIEPGNLMCRVNLGAALGKLGRTEEALVVLRKGLDSSPESPEILNAMAVAHAHQGEPRVAEDLLRRSLALRPDQPEIRAMLAEIQEMP